MLLSQDGCRRTVPCWKFDRTRFKRGRVDWKGDDCRTKEPGQYSSNQDSTRTAGGTPKGTDSLPRVYALLYSHSSDKEMVVLLSSRRSASGWQEGAIIASESRDEREGSGEVVVKLPDGESLGRSDPDGIVSDKIWRRRCGGRRRVREREKKLSTTSLVWLTKKDQGIRFDVNRMRCKKNPEASLYRPKTTA